MVGQVDLKVLAVWRRGRLDHLLVAGHQVVGQGELVLQPGGGHLTGGHHIIHIILREREGNTHVILLLVQT